MQPAQKSLHVNVHVVVHFGHVITPRLTLSPPPRHGCLQVVLHCPGLFGQIVVTFQHRQHHDIVVNPLLLGDGVGAGGVGTHKEQHVRGQGGGTTGPRVTNGVAQPCIAAGTVDGKRDRGERGGGRDGGEGGKGVPGQGWGRGRRGGGEGGWRWRGGGGGRVVVVVVVVPVGVPVVQEQQGAGGGEGGGGASSVVGVQGRLLFDGAGVLSGSNAQGDVVKGPNVVKPRNVDGGGVDEGGDEAKEKEGEEAEAVVVDAGAQGAEDVLDRFEVLGGRGPTVAWWGWCMWVQHGWPVVLGGGGGGWSFHC